MTARRDAATARRTSLASGIAVAGALVLLAATRWGIGTGPDSAGYLQGARAIAASGGAAIVRGDPAGDAALIHFAPFYSFLLAVGAVIGLDAYDWARWLHALLFGLNIVLAGSLLRTVLGATGPLWAAGVVVLAMAPALLTLHLTVLSEPVFLLLTFGGLWRLAAYLDDGRRLDLVLAAAALGLACLARYAGAAGIGFGALALIAFGRGRITGRTRDAFVFAGIAALPMLAWMVRNALVATSATGRQLAFHPIDRSHIWQGVYTLAGWLGIPSSMPNAVRLGLCAAVASLVGWALVSRLATRGAPDRTTGSAATPALVGVLATYAMAYLAFLVVSISLFDANTPLDDRILSPIFVAGTVLVPWSVQTLAARRPRLTVIPLVGLSLVAATHVAQGGRVAAASYSGGWGFSSLAWRHSPMVTTLRALPDTVPVYSNVPEVVYLQTGRPARALPRPWLPMIREPNPGYTGEVAALLDGLAEEPSVVAIFAELREGPTSRLHADLRADPAIRERWRLSDGVVLCAVCPE